ncbi:MAG: HoxN/HupN/NixA family nickel/cobalt transporter, partial [Actinomycetes bacterium]
MSALSDLAVIYRGREQLPAATRLVVVGGAVLMLHGAAAALLVLGTAAAHPIALGLVLTAYLAGVKHSYDWDHVSAIDNSTRRFVAQHKDPVSVGFAFSLGHSSVVVLAGLLVVSGAALAGHLMEAGSAGNQVLVLIGGTVSGLFLLAMGLFNGTAFLNAANAWRKAAAGREVQDKDLETTGFMARLLAKPLAKVERPRNIYVLGFLFGLGFDTATTIGLLVMTTAVTLAGVSPLALMTIPLAFTAAMTLCDSVNGIAMMRLYRSALGNPQRRLGFNAVVTGLSAVSALFAAAITLGGLVASFGMDFPVVAWLARIDLGDAGLALVASFAAIWL